MKTKTLILAMAFVLTGCGGSSSNSGGGSTETGTEVAASPAVANKVVLRVVVDPACGAKTGYPLRVFVNGESIGFILGASYYAETKVNRSSTAIVQAQTTGGFVIGPIGVAVGDGTQQVLSC